MHDDTKRVLTLFATQPAAVMDAHDVADAALIPYARARRALHNLSRYGRVRHIGGWLYALPD
jgi:DNA-binding IclR family transcriptional regulator